MIKIKYFIFLFLLLVCCGWTSTYTLEENNLDFTENIVLYLDFNLQQQAEQYRQYEDGDFFENNLLYDKIRSTNETEKYYQKNITNSEKSTTVFLQYTYSPEEFADAKYLFKCFDNYNSFKKNDYYMINISGDFWCENYGIDKIVLITNKKVQGNYNSSEKNTYIWNISEKNNSIQIKIIKENIFIKIIGLLLIAFFIICGFVFIAKSKRNSKI